LDIAVSVRFSWSVLGEITVARCGEKMKGEDVSVEKFVVLRESGNAIDGSPARLQTAEQGFCRPWGWP